MAGVHESEHEIERGQFPVVIDEDDLLEHDAQRTISFGEMVGDPADPVDAYAGARFANLHCRVDYLQNVTVVSGFGRGWLDRHVSDEVHGPRWRLLRYRFATRKTLDPVVHT
jgi:hypothetical protein